MYELLLFAHVTGAITWFGAGIIFQFTAERARDRDTIAAIVRFNGLVGKYYFMVASLFVLAAGIAMVFVGDWGFDEPFVIGGITGFTASSVIGGGVIGRAATDLETALAGGTDDAVLGAMGRLRNAGRLDFLIMLAVVLMMTVKPGT